MNAIIDPIVDAGAKKSLSRQLGEIEARREQLRQTLDAVSEQSSQRADDVVAAVRQAFVETRDQYQGILSPSQFNRFVLDAFGPMEVLAGGKVRRKRLAPKASDDALGAVGIAGARSDPASAIVGELFRQQVQCAA